MTVAPITATRMPGTRLVFLRSKITASEPAPTAKAVQFALPPRIASAIAHRFRSGPSFSMEKPKSLGSWLISTVSAIPFM
jgi:hypothetical protein